MAQAVWKLKVVWDHAGTGSVRSRNIHQQIERAEKRLGKLNDVEATRLAGVNDSLKRAMRSCRGGGEMTQAANAIEAGVAVTQQLESTGQVPAASTKRVARRTLPQVAHTRVTRGGRARAEVARSSEEATEAKRQQEVREEELAQEAQEMGPEGSRILGERGAEVQEWGRLIMAALEKRDPGQLEKRRAGNGVWYTAGEEDEEEPQGASGDGSRWVGWEEVTQAWEAAGQVAATMRMDFEDRDSV